MSAGGAGHFYRLDTDTDTLTEDTAYGADRHQPPRTRYDCEREACLRRRGRRPGQVKVLDLYGNEITAISLDWRPGIPDGPDTIARRGSNIYVTLRFAGQVARIKAQTGAVGATSTSRRPTRPADGPSTGSRFGPEQALGGWPEELLDRGALATRGSTTPTATSSPKRYGCSSAIIACARCSGAMGATTSGPTTAGT